MRVSLNGGLCGLGFWGGGLPFVEGVVGFRL